MKPPRPTRSQPVTQIVGQYDRKSIHAINDVLSQINTSNEAVEFDGEYIRMGSQRYHVFAKSLQCACCGLTGSYFAMERAVDKRGNPTCDGFHFNLYAINSSGHSVLMTKDHIIPKAKGGPNTLRNYQTMCCECNKEKGSE